MHGGDTGMLRGTFYLREFQTSAAALAVKPETATVHNAKDIEAILPGFKEHKTIVEQLPYRKNPCKVVHCDARALPLKESSVDFIITSPPYINVFNYHQNFRAIIETFHFDLLKVAQSEFGSNRKNRGNRFKTVIQYCLDMELAIRSFWIALKPNAKIVLVLGRESNVRSTPFYNGQLIIEILESSNGFSEIKNLERQFTNKFGINIKEDIILATKSKAFSTSFTVETGKEPTISFR